MRQLFRMLLLGGLLVVAGAGCKDNAARLREAAQDVTIGNWVKAEELTTKILKKEKANVPALILNGLALYHQNRLEEAERRLAQAAELAPAEFAPQYFHGWILVRQERYADALPPLRQAFQTQPRHQELLKLLSRCCVEQNLPEGIRYLQVLSSFPEVNRKAAVHNALGYLALNQRNYPLAERKFKDAWMRENADLTAPRNLAVLYDQYLRNPREALSHYRAYHAQLLRYGHQQELASQVEARIRQLEREAPRTPAGTPPRPAATTNSTRPPTRRR
ncbi:MAG: tetratricopeptide repeat protein [Lentisphaeria bacterium]|jgi:uncharacterized protein HemY